MLAALAACLAVVATPVTAAVPWHADLAQAKAASLISHRPVLIVFTAKWSEASVALDGTTLANPEATALVTACFEPVKVDVDADPETTRRMGVSYLPTACVIDLDDRVLATFDCPDSPASFIAAAGRAAQDAATAKAATQAAAAPAISSAPASRPRDHSDFTAATPAAPTPAATHSFEPSLPKAPPAAWPAERAIAAPTAAPASPASSAAVRPSLEPTGSAAPAATSGVASWLGGQQPAPTPAPAPAAPAPAAPVAPAPPTALAPTAPPATPATEDKPKQSNAFIAALQKPFTLLPKWPGTGKPAASTAAASPSAAATTADAAASMPLGLEGYCPVTLAEKGTWVEGRAQFGARHRGRTYLFAGAEQQRTFLADPDRFAPALSGDDPVLAFDAGRSIPGQRRYGVTYQARIYLFSSPETRTAFTADPGKYTARVRVAEAGSATPNSVQR